MGIDLKRDLPHLYRPGTRDFVEVQVPPMTYLAIDGHGDPNTSPEYERAVAALYTSGYAVRAAFRARTGDVFVVGPLEGLWTSPDPAAFADRRKGDWDWTMLIALPGQVTGDDVDTGLARAVEGKPDLPIGGVRPRELVEGRALQILHVGPYDAEAATLARLHSHVMPDRGLTFAGPHHEIYLSDPRKVAPERMRTVLRQPVRPVD